MKFKTKNKRKTLNVSKFDKIFLPLKIIRTRLKPIPTFKKNNA